MLWILETETERNKKEVPHFYHIATSPHINCNVLVSKKV